MKESIEFSLDELIVIFSAFITSQAYVWSPNMSEYMTGVQRKRLEVEWKIYEALDRLYKKKYKNKKYKEIKIKRDKQNHDFTPITYTINTKDQYDNIKEALSWYNKDFSAWVDDINSKFINAEKLYYVLNESKK